MARTIAKDHDEKRSSIQHTAAKVFADTGFDRASMTQLAKACGISKAAIYHYYDSKDDLLFDILETHLKDLRDRVAMVTQDGKSPEAYLRAVILEILMAYRGADDYHRVQANALGVLAPDQQRVLMDCQRALLRQVTGAVRAVVSPEIADDKQRLRSITMSLFGMLNWYYMWNTGKGIETRKEYADTVGDLIMNGVNGL